MKIVYDAANSIEAHMVMGMLEQQNIKAYVHGVHLQGGIGEIPTIGLVKVNVDDENYLAAKNIIRHWESTEVYKDSTELSDNNISTYSRYRGVLGLFIGFISGAIAISLYLNSTPITQDGIDYNGDGINDEVWTFKNKLLIKTEIDNNFDGKFDNIYLLKNGLLDSQNLDDNFDGKFDSENFFNGGAVFYSKSDSNNDGEIDVVVDYQVNQATHKSSIFSPSTKLIKKIQYFERNSLKSAELDTDDDGKMDTIITYDFFEEEVSRKAK